MSYNERYNASVQAIAEIFLKATSDEVVGDDVTEISTDLLMAATEGDADLDEMKSIDFTDLVEAHGFMLAGLAMVKAGEEMLHDLIQAGTKGMVVEHPEREGEEDEGSIR